MATAALEVLISHAGAAAEINRVPGYWHGPPGTYGEYVRIMPEADHLPYTGTPLVNPGYIAITDREQDIYTMPPAGISPGTSVQVAIGRGRVWQTASIQENLTVTANGPTAPGWTGWQQRQFVSETHTMRGFGESEDPLGRWLAPEWEDLGWMHGRLRLEVDWEAGSTTWHVRAYYRPELRSGGSSAPYAEFDLPSGDGYPPKHFVIGINSGGPGLTRPGSGVIYQARTLTGNVWREWDFDRVADMAGWRNHGLSRYPVAQQLEGWPWATAPAFDPLDSGLIYCPADNRFSRIARTEEGELFAMDTDGMGIFWNTRLDPNDRIIVEHRDVDDHDAPWVRTAVIDDSGQYGSPQITGNDREMVVAAMRYDRKLYAWYSSDEGQSWSGPHPVTSAEI